ncbi:MAG TPA: GlsB/YeaQ/YmgE family stress response membrane protein [Anaerolineales bacterium]|nr:GlsB/YeaQ/YmgE family stress response membrane protein [Anaerolineales bacterium]
MSVLNLLLLLLVAAVAGSIGQALAGYSVGGCLMSIIVGFIGAWLGSWLSVQLGLPEPLTISIGGETFPVLWSIIGSALFVAVLALITRRRVIV